ncbi:MAG: metalloregulator ArsR/SmtB family transcription factor [Sphingomonas sp.]|nr:metalloregulator ArsR/SmtB family transcription factor [Sphingomonas sp.]
MKAMQVMSALSQATRLEVFQRLVESLPDGMASGELAAAIGSSPNTMSAHLAVLTRAGVVRSDKVGRTVVYRAVTKPVEELSGFLAQACEMPSDLTS